MSIPCFEWLRSASLPNLRPWIMTDLGFLAAGFPTHFENQRFNSEATAQILRESGRIRVTVRIPMIQIRIVSE
jgi:hypothetical protein